MSRTTLCVVTAVGLAALSLGVTITRHQILGDEVQVPRSPGTWKVTLLVQGELRGDAHLVTLMPLDFGRQHVLRESCRSTELLDKLPEVRHPERRQVLWSKRGNVPDGRFRAHYEFYCSIDVHRPTSPMSALARSLYAPPQPGEHLNPLAFGDDNGTISDLARRLTEGREQPADQVEALYRYVSQEIEAEPNLNGPPVRPVDCLHLGSGDSGAQSRLLATMLRSRGIPTRLVSGLTLTKGHEQVAHTWVEAWLNDHWFPMCPFYHHFGKVPATYLVFHFGDSSMVRGRNIRNLHYAFLLERVTAGAASGDEPSFLRRVFLTLSLYMLPPRNSAWSSSCCWCPWPPWWSACSATSSAWPASGPSLRPWSAWLSAICVAFPACWSSSPWCSSAGSSGGC